MSYFNFFKHDLEKLFCNFNEICKYKYKLDILTALKTFHKNKKFL